MMMPEKVICTVLKYVYVGNLEDERGLFAQSDAYITNRSLDNVKHMDMADFYGIPVISSVDRPIFTEINVQKMKFGR